MDESQTMVMVVDDDAAVRSSLARLFTSAHLSFAMFDTAEAFLAEVGASTRGCAIVDVQLPGMTGFCLQNIISRDFPSLEVIIITGFDEETAEQRALGGGAIAFLRKPFDPAALLGLLRKSLAPSRT